MSDDIETVDHTARFIQKINELGKIEGLENLTAGLYIALHAEHDLVIRLHERLLMARSYIKILQDNESDEYHPNGIVEKWVAGE